MFFIHGGGYAYGGAHDTELDGTQTVKHRGDILVVTTNYRLDILGFYAGESLRGRGGDNSTGNYGIQVYPTSLQTPKARPLPPLTGNPGWKRHRINALPSSGFTGTSWRSVGTQVVS